jgi:hypothetical protein
MVTLAIGNMRNWMLMSLITGFTTIALAYYLGKLFGMQFVMVVIAVMDIPAFIFLMRRSFAGLDLTYSEVYSIAILPVILSILPLLVWAGFVIGTNQIESLISLIVCIVIFGLLWLLGLFTLGISKLERKLIRAKLGLI